MTYPTYTHQQLRSKSLAQLKRIYSEIGCTVEVTDRRYKDEWMSAIAEYQSAQLQRIDEQDIAQGEFEQYIADQANAIASEELTIKEINPHHFEIFAGKQLIAYISYDSSEFVTQPWVVMVNGEVIFRHNTQAQCFRYIEWHLNNSQLPSRNSQLNAISTISKSKEFRSLMDRSPNHIDNCELRTANCELLQDGTLPLPLPAPAQFPEVPTITEISFYDQEASVDDQLVASVSYDQNNYEDLYWRVLVNDVEIFRDNTPERCHSYVKQQYQQGTLPVQQAFEEPCTTGNEIMVQIFNACEQHGLELLDDGIYQDDKKLGEVGFTDGYWWVIRAASEGQKVACESVDEAVRMLVVEVLAYEELLDKAFDELTADEWLLVMKSEPVRELVAA